MCLKKLLEDDFLRMVIDDLLCLREKLYPCKQRATKTFLPAEVDMDSSRKIRLLSFSVMKLSNVGQ